MSTGHAEGAPHRSHNSTSDEVCGMGVLELHPGILRKKKSWAQLHQQPRVDTFYHWLRDTPTHHPGTPQPTIRLFLRCANASKHAIGVLLFSTPLLASTHRQWFEWEILISVTPRMHK